jgi:hypothetical protein
MISVNGTYFRTGLVIAGVALLAGEAGHVQRLRLSTLRAEIAQWRAKAAGLEATPGHARRESFREPQMDREKADSGGLSLAGEETVPEALRLVALLAPGWRADQARWIGWLDWPQEEEPLEDLMLRMGAGAGKKLLEDPALEEPERRVLRQMFVRVNPEQSLLLSMSYPPDEVRDRWITQSFGRWAGADPTTAVRWYRQMEAKSDPVAQLWTVSLDAMNAEATVDPVRAVAKLEQLLTDHPMTSATGLARGFISTKDVNGRIALMNALNAAEMGFAGDAKLKEQWGVVFAEMNRSLIGEPFDDAMAVVDGSYTPEQRREFAKKVPGSNSFEMGAVDFLHWVDWLAGIDLPPDERHPLLGMLNYPSDPSGEPVWLDQLPEGELKNVAVAHYAREMIYDNPEVAARWLVKLPAGEKRTAIARTIAELLERKDEAAAEAFRKSEGLEK